MGPISGLSLQGSYICSAPYWNWNTGTYNVHTAAAAAATITTTCTTFDFCSMTSYSVSGRVSELLVSIRAGTFTCQMPFLLHQVVVEVEQSLTPHPTQYRSFRRRSSQPIT